MKTTTLLRMGFLILPLALALPARAADEPPLRVNSRLEGTGGGAQGKAGRVLALEFENRSGKVIAAYILRIEHREPGADKPVAVEISSAMTRALGFSKGRPGFQPGEQWTDRIPVQEISEDAPAVSLDLVVYEDGSHWGPDKSKRLEWLKGIRTGAGLEQQASPR